MAKYKAMTHIQLADCAGVSRRILYKWLAEDEDSVNYDISKKKRGAINAPRLKKYDISMVDNQTVTINLRRDHSTYFRHPVFAPACTYR